MIEEFVAMHMRSEAASAPANAQQHPQFDWSRISPMIFAHWGQRVAESNSSGMMTFGATTARSIVPSCMRAWIRSFQPSLTPQSFVEAPGASAANLGFATAVQLMPF